MKGSYSYLLVASALLTCWGCFNGEKVTGPLSGLPVPKLPAESLTPYVFVDRLYDDSLRTDPEYRGSAILETSHDDFNKDENTGMIARFTTEYLKNETAPLSIIVFRITTESMGFRSIRFVSDVDIPATQFDTVSFGARGTSTDANILIGEGAGDEFMTSYGYGNDEVWRNITIPLSNSYTFNVGDRIIGITPTGSDPIGSYLEIANVIFRLE